MSPLARSLLALSALLSAADAFCTSEVIGCNTDQEELSSYEFSAKQVEKGCQIKIADSCKFGKTIGVAMNACNSHNSRTYTVGQSPNVSLNMTHAYVQCEMNACPTGVHVHVVQYCDSGKIIPMP